MLVMTMMMPWQQQALQGLFPPLVLVEGRGLILQGRAKPGVQEAHTTAVEAQAGSAAQFGSNHAQRRQAANCHPSLHLQAGCINRQGHAHNSSTAASAAAAAAAAAAVLALLQSVSHQQQLQWPPWTSA
jgi:hypothetical protein